MILPHELPASLSLPQVNAQESPMTESLPPTPTARPQPLIRLPILKMLLVGPAAASGVGLLVWGLSHVIPQIQPTAPVFGALAAACGLSAGALVSAPWKPGTAQSLTMRMFAGQGLSMFATLASCAIVWFASRPEPVAAGLTAAAGYMTGLMSQIAIFAAAARSAMASAPHQAAGLPADAD